MSEEIKSPYRVGNKVFVRTVTYHYTGEIVIADGGGIVLKDAAWIADSGRFSDALKTGEFSEVEPYPDDVAVLLCFGAIVDVADWKHDLPRKQK